MKLPCVQHAHHPLVQVGQPAAGVVEVTEVVAREPERHGVDGEVAAHEVLVEPRLLDDRQDARLGIGLAPRRRKVDAQLVGAHGRGAEALVLARLAAESLGQRAGDRAGVSLDGDIEVHGVGPAQQVTHGPAHQKGGREALERRQQPLHSRDAAYALAQFAFS